MNQGRDSTIEPAYLAEKKEVAPEPNLIELDVTPTSEAQTITPESPVDGYSQVNVAAAPSADLIIKTYEVPIPSYYEEINPDVDEVDGYSLVRLTGPSDLSTWTPVVITIQQWNNTIRIDSTAEELTQAYQSGKNHFYLDVHQQEI